MYEIEKNVEIPPDGRGSPKYPFGKLEIGDSFFVPNKKLGSISTLVTWHKTHRGKGKNFTCRTVEGGVRVWRIA